MVDALEFFREVTLRICGSLEIEEALHRSLLYIGHHLPADGLSLSTYYLTSGTSKIIAVTTREGGRTLAKEVPQQPGIQSRIAAWYRQPDADSHIRMMSSVKNDPLLGPVARAMDVPDVPAMQMRLKLDRQMIGSLVVTNISGQHYTPAHARMLAAVNEPFAVALSNYLRYREIIELKELLADDNRYLQKELRRSAGDEVIGADRGLKPVMDLVRQVAPLDSPVLLLGETGTGKELVANAIHNLSRRKDGPFIAVNCGAISPTLMDSELFGHEKGAFTGALAQKRGRFERARGGTIFLDEIGELTSEAQVRLLRVLQEKQIERVGGTKPIKIDIRVIAATHRDLDQMLRSGMFREDLFFRLKVFPITLPPLRCRRGDIAALVDYFILKKSREMRLSGPFQIAPGALETLVTYPWPGNVRELENAVERAMILRSGDRLVFPEFQSPRTASLPTEAGWEAAADLGLDNIITRHISSVLEMTQGRVHGPSGAAALLQINPSTLRKRMRKLGIRFGRQWPADYSQRRPE